ncbi:MAG: quinone-interacting membrane-bound oxidoreductase complex subunit QmoC [Bacteroidales bacterium]|nr:quinone-interacting membrane-bound oxidoreductase complex subunit QmoC [Bacteroidales bacterium]
MTAIPPDINFKKELKKISKSSLNECMQCGTCSVVCSLAPEEKPFPRKEMFWASWGQKEKLIANADVWLCHQCGDCSTHCPRGVKPADVLSAIRQMSYKNYARPKFFGSLLAKPALLPIAILIPVIIIVVILLMAGTFTIPEGPVNYSRFFPHAWLNGSFTLITFVIYGLAASGILRFRKDLQSNFQGLKAKTGFFKSLLQVKNEILLHSKFGNCTTQKSRKIAHFLVFYGFIILLLVTAYAIIAAITHNYPLGLTNPFKMLGNAAALMLTLGLGIMIFNRLFKKDKTGKSNYADWLLLISFFLLTISGIVVQLARLQNWGPAYHLYFFHLVCVWFVIIYLPYTKFAHMIYRILALSFAHSIGRDSPD